MLRGRVRNVAVLLLLLAAYWLGGWLSGLQRTELEVRSAVQADLVFICYDAGFMAGMMPG
jgi:hypothetical protein